VAGPAPGDGLVAPPVDPELVRRTTAAVLTTLDNVAQHWVGAEAAKAGADDKRIAMWQRQAALPPGPKELMVQTSPEVLAALGVNAANYPLAAFGTGLATWGAALMLVLGELKQLQRERAIEERAAAAPAAPAEADGPAN
jgi:hypothetical protein